MHEKKTTADRLAAYSDAVFAVIVTIMVLELRPPDQPAFSALWPLWTTADSYAGSYLFIAIIWINHHHLMRFVGSPTLKLNMDQLHSSVAGVAAAVCDRVDCAHTARFIPRGVLRRIIREHRYCVTSSSTRS
jgi:hypothetical protein